MTLCLISLWSKVNDPKIELLILKTERCDFGLHQWGEILDRFAICRPPSQFHFFLIFFPTGNTQTRITPCPEAWDV